MIADTIHIDVVTILVIVLVVLGIVWFLRRVR